MNNQKIRQEIVESLAELSEEQLLQIQDLIKQVVIAKSNYESGEKRKILIQSLQGKYAHASTSSEDFAQGKQAEIDWENRHQ